MKSTTLVTILLFVSKCTFAQTFNINLSSKHASRLSTIKTGHKRLVKFYKFYKKDSTRHIRKQERFHRKQLDSAYRAKAKDHRLRSRLARQGVAVPERISLEDSLDRDLKSWYAVMKDSAASDSVKQHVRSKVKELAVEKAKLHPGFQQLLEKYQVTGDSVDWKTLTHQVPGLDTLSGVFDSSPEELFNVAEAQATKQFQKYGGGMLGKEFGQAEELRSLPDKYKGEVEKYTDKEYLKGHAKEKAVREAVDYFAAHGDKLTSAQAKMSKLLSKYREFSNSNDLSNAVKRTSMEGKTFWQHLLIGGNFNIVSTQPFSLDFSPLLGYKFTTAFSIGVGMNYRYTYSDSIKNNYYVSPNNTSFKAFINYDVIKSFFAYGEWEHSGIKMSSNDKSDHTWKNNYFAGVGRKFLVHPKLYLTIIALYNLNGEDHNPVHPKRFQVRMGFQLSELATRKKKIDYDPNRY